MDPSALPSGPFAALTFIAAPALLTNASSVLALSTINRMLRTRDSMRELLAQSAAPPAPRDGAFAPAEHAPDRLVHQVNRVERQATLLLGALHAIYVALAAFASATLVTLLGAGLAPLIGGFWPGVFGGIGVVLGFAGVGGLVFGCTKLFSATRLSLMNIREEADIIRQRQAARIAGESAAAAPPSASSPAAPMMVTKRSDPAP